ncbi:hypothetical protein TH63_15910 [Rufibacter radiotolerans]|uniref:Uncharacterized protein n=1 Tax=Rufibacter radiotolerans TaxID=1379910 RepID=A0A0H4W8J1_9BACT|nr:hypothetical protein [Rufibacter radiotolerans]AKQ46771.1 hypothetical protein TH63_15910 [Rufibacter radiotolerans]
MRSSLKVDIGLIGFGIALLAWQRFWLEPARERAAAYSSIPTQSMQAASTTNATLQHSAPQWEITYPENSPYQNLTPPPGVTPNPFLAVPRLVRETGPVRDYSGKDTDMRLLLAKYEKEDYYFVIQQQAANEMLRRELFPHYYQDPTQPDMLEAIGFYTQQLVEAGSADAKLVYMGLQALKGHWPKKQIAHLAKATAQQVQTVTASVSNDTTTVAGYYRQIYARELTKLSNRLQENQNVDNTVDKRVYKPVDKDSNLLSSTN